MINQGNEPVYQLLDGSSQIEDSLMVCRVMLLEEILEDFERAASVLLIHISDLEDKLFKEFLSQSRVFGSFKLGGCSVILAGEEHHSPENSEALVNLENRKLVHLIQLSNNSHGLVI